MSKEINVLPPCNKCYDYLLHCKNCSKHMEWEKMSKSLSDEDWNNEVIKEMNNEISKIQEKYHKLLR